MIHRFRVQNFKSIADVDVDLSPVTVFIGKSGTGKSNFVQALRCLRDVLLAKPEVAQSWQHWRPVPATDAPTVFDVEFSIAGIDERFRYELSLSNSTMENQPANERLSLGEHCLFHQKQARPGATRWAVEPALVPLPRPGEIALGRIPAISEIVIAFTALTVGIGFHAFSDQVLSRPSGGKLSSSGLADDARNSLGVLKDIASDLQNFTVRKTMVASLQHVVSSVSSIGLDDIRKPSTILVGHKSNGKTFVLNLSQESDGFRRFYAYLLALYQRPPRQTLIFEHPEDGIHPGALSLLAGEFLSAQKTGRGQILLTTHSPRFLDHFQVDQIRVVEIDDLKTRIGLLAAEQAESVRENLLEPGELLTADPARIMEAVGA